MVANPVYSIPFLYEDRLYFGAISKPCPSYCFHFEPPPPLPQFSHHVTRQNPLDTRHGPLPVKPGRDIFAPSAEMVDVGTCACRIYVMCIRTGR